MNRSVVSNIVKLSVGIIFLTISYFYTQTYKAELTSIASTFRLLGQKVQVVVYKILDRDWQMLQVKNEFLGSYKELYSTLVMTHCLSGDDMKNFLQAYEALRRDSVSEFSEKMYLYNLIRQEMAAKIEKYCKM